MANFKELFGKEVCSCGEKGTRILSVHTKIVGFACEKHFEERKQEIALRIKKN
jgi:hypothetical protein